MESVIFHEDYSKSSQPSTLNKAHEGFQWSITIHSQVELDIDVERSSQTSLRGSTTKDTLRWSQPSTSNKSLERATDDRLPSCTLVQSDIDAVQSSQTSLRRSTAKILPGGVSHQHRINLMKASDNQSPFTLRWSHTLMSNKSLKQASDDRSSFAPR